MTRQIKNGLLPVRCIFGTIVVSTARRGRVYPCSNQFIDTSFGSPHKRYSVITFQWLMEFDFLYPDVVALPFFNCKLHDDFSVKSSICIARFQGYLVFLLYPISYIVSLHPDTFLNTVTSNTTMRC